MEDLKAKSWIQLKAQSLKGLALGAGNPFKLTFLCDPLHGLIWNSS